MKHALPRAILRGFPLVPAFILALLLPPAAGPQVLRPPAEVRVPQVRESMLVSTEWLAQRLADPDVVILHVARQKADYEAGHIPGARFLALSQITVTRDHVANELPPVEELQRVLESLGVGDKTRVILYGELQGLLAARTWFTLDYLGHGDRAALLDGGLEKWRAEARPLSKEEPQVKPASFTPRVQPGVIVHLAQVRDLSWEAQKPDSSVVLIDARPADDYLGGRQAEGVSRPGHIPGAINLPWSNALEGKDDLQLLPAPELRQLFKSAGATPGKKVVTYCRTGVMSSYAYFMAKYLGYDVSMYDGSFQEWSNTAGTKVEVGASR
jgi:thiosulfate/3-mercaptopyruvate sulfurtransferase